MIFNFFCHCKDNDLTKKNKKLQNDFGVFCISALLVVNDFPYPFV